MPGRIIQAMKLAGTINPVIMLDELDKVGADFRGDPASALLEVLDPEQNHSFRDHYINLPFDLKVLLGKSNLPDPIPSALRDRLEIIRIPGYTAREKTQIAKRYIVGRQGKQNGLNEDEIHITTPAIRALIEGHTREAGLRELERKIGTICRKVARRIVSGEMARTTIRPNSLKHYLSSSVQRSRLTERHRLCKWARLDPDGGQV